MKTVLTALALLLYSGAAWAAPPPKLKTEPPAIQATEANAKYTENVVEQSDVVNVANVGEVARVAAPESASIIMLMTNDTELAMEREGIGLSEGVEVPLGSRLYALASKPMQLGAMNFWSLRVDERTLDNGGMRIYLLEGEVVPGTNGRTILNC